MSNLTILNQEIRPYENLFNLNDLHIAGGKQRKHQPSNFIRLDTTQELIKEIEQENQNIKAVKIIRGTYGGTYVCEELVLAYATWISPKFHLVVLRAFLAMHRNEPKQLALPNPEKKYPFNLAEHDLQAIAWDWFALVKCVEFTNYLIPALDNIQSKFAAQAHSIVSEYGSMLRRHQPLIQKLTTDFKVEMWGNENWNRILPTIRDNDILRPKHRLGGF
ncbi:P22AR C-terminal domain-containing protein [Rodentibacter pneumotropicus]|uniref:P22AR C-terminal domain-containing protein n=1 Tax=Rodentibacter pneumotropicus TaxID=758 RepID=UPI00232F647C|nr:P22AR C-terminal domain-containing protein [Rodentibacter pneumotropicus]MDC2824563.1 P22AR C-terminal domain-containing protein [Rodentibacter pneumotropicus]